MREPLNWIFNLAGLGEIIVAAGADFAFGKDAGFAALFLVDLGYRLWRIGTRTKAQALLFPWSGGHFLFLPCWIWGILLLTPTRFLPGFMQPGTVEEPNPGVPSMTIGPELLFLFLVVGAVVGGLRYRTWKKRRRLRQQAALDAERWLRLPLVLEALDAVFTELEAEIRPGVTPAALATLMEDGAHRRGVRSSVRNFRGFPASACISVNDVFMNAVPSRTPIGVGDLVNVQFGVTDGLAYAHQAWAYCVGEAAPQQALLLDAGVEALTAATRVAKGTGRVRDISQAIQDAARAHGCEPNRDFVGCGIWERPFEPPPIPCYVPSEHADVRLRAGMVLLVQAILHSGQPVVEVLQDQWSVHSKDGKPAVAMSRMLLLTERGAKPLTSIRRTRTNGTP